MAEVDERVSPRKEAGRRMDRALAGLILRRATATDDDFAADLDVVLAARVALRDAELAAAVGRLRAFGKAFGGDEMVSRAAVLRLITGKEGADHAHRRSPRQTYDPTPCCVVCFQPWPCDQAPEGADHAD